MKGARALIPFFLLLCSLSYGLDRITFFDSHIEVQENGDFMVTERITVFSTHSEIAHGIFRNIPIQKDEFLPGLHYTPVSIIHVLLISPIYKHRQIVDLVSSLFLFMGAYELTFGF